MVLNILPKRSKFLAIFTLKEGHSLMIIANKIVARSSEIDFYFKWLKPLLSEQGCLDHSGS